MNKEYERDRFERGTADDALRYMRCYQRAATAAKRKFGRRFEYRAKWVESAWSFRYLLRN